MTDPVWHFNMYYVPNCAVLSCDLPLRKDCESCWATWYWAGSMRPFLTCAVRQNDKSLLGSKELKKKCMEELLSDGFIWNTDIAVRCWCFHQIIRVVTTRDLLLGGKGGFWDSSLQNRVSLSWLHICNMCAFIRQRQRENHRESINVFVPALNRQERGPRGNLQIFYHIFN